MENTDCRALLHNHSEIRKALIVRLQQVDSVIANCQDAYCQVDVEKLEEAVDAVGTAFHGQKENLLQKISP